MGEVYRKEGREKMNKEKKFAVIFSAKFGSEFQYYSAMNALKILYMAWQKFYNTTHKNNLICDARIKVDYIEEVRES